MSGQAAYLEAGNSSPTAAITASASCSGSSSLEVSRLQRNWSMSFHCAVVSNHAISADCKAWNWPLLARQDAKEHESSDDIRSRSDDSYSPRRHWCSARSPTVKCGSGVAYRRVMTSVVFRRRSRLGVCSVSAPQAPDRRDRRSDWPRRAKEDATRLRYCIRMRPA